MSENSSKAYLNYQKGRQKLYPGCCSALFSNTEERLEEATNCFKEAGDLYILDKNYKEAAKCFVECALIKQANKENPCEYYEQAMTCYKKVNDNENYYDVLTKLIENNITFANFNLAGKFCMKRGELNELLEQNNNAMQDYETALKYFQMDMNSSKFDINKCYLKKADLLIMNNIDNYNEEIDEALSIYEEIGDKCNEIGGMGSFVNNAYFKNVLCNLYYKDSILSVAFLHKFEEKSNEFKNSVEDSFLNKLLKYFNEDEDENENELISIESLTDLFIEYKSKFNNIESYWVNVFMNKIEDKIKKIIKQKPNFAEDEDFK